MSKTTKYLSLLKSSSFLVWWLLSETLSYFLRMQSSSKFIKVLEFGVGTINTRRFGIKKLFGRNIIIWYWDESTDCYSKYIEGGEEPFLTILSINGNGVGWHESDVVRSFPKLGPYLEVQFFVDLGSLEPECFCVFQLLFRYLKSCCIEFNFS